MALQFCISQDIFDRFPGYCRGVVVAHGLQNGSSPQELLDELRAAETALPGQLSLENIASHPRISSWREAFRSLGIKPTEFRPSVEALARRVLRGEALPAISRVVDIGTLVSIRSLVPVGAHAIDPLTQDISLRLADGSEVFEVLGGDALEHPLPGEVVFVEGSTVLTRRWTWRQGRHTLVGPETRAIECNVDGLPPVTPQEVEQICQEVGALLQACCGGTWRYEIVSGSHPCMGLD